MLKDQIRLAPYAGKLNKEIHYPFTVKLEIISFIAEELQRWRDRDDRRYECAEKKLTSQLCDHLNDTAYYSEIWSHLKFKTEEGDEKVGNRDIDLVVKPCELHHLWVLMKTIKDNDKLDKGLKEEG